MIGGAQWPEVSAGRGGGGPYIFGSGPEIPTNLTEQKPRAQKYNRNRHIKLVGISREEVDKEVGVLRLEPLTGRSEGAKGLPTALICICSHMEQTTNRTSKSMEHVNKQREKQTNKQTNKQTSKQASKQAAAARQH